MDESKQRFEALGEAERQTEDDEGEEDDDDDSGGGGGGGNDVELEEVDDDDSGSGEVRSQLGKLDCSLPPPIKAQLGGSQLETLANSDLPCDFVASSRHFSEVPVVYALLWLLDSAAFKMKKISSVDIQVNRTLVVFYRLLPF